MKFLLVLCGFLFSADVLAQSEGEETIFGYAQAIMPGRAPGNIEEGNRDSSLRAEQSYQYFIYLASEARIYPVEIWIKGKSRGLSWMEIKKKPVILEDYPNGRGKTTLVPTTRKRVIQISPVVSRNFRQSLVGRRLARTNELVILYHKNGKMYYSALEKLSMLEPAFMQ